MTIRFTLIDCRPSVMHTQNKQSNSPRTNRNDCFVFFLTYYVLFRKLLRYLEFTLNSNEVCYALNIYNTFFSLCIYALRDQSKYIRMGNKKGQNLLKVFLLRLTMVDNL